MIIFYTNSFYGKEIYQSSYDLVLDAIRQTGAEIISPETNNYLELLSAKEKKVFLTPEAQHYQAIKKGIQKADAVIIEISHQDFQIGWEASLACLNKKPLLCLSLHEDFSAKIAHPYFHAAKYAEITIDNIIEDFVARTKPGLYSQRFNFFLSEKQLAQLRNRSKELNLSPSEYLRKMIDKSNLI
jgi:hypothetical protein